MMTKSFLCILLSLLYPFCWAEGQIPFRVMSYNVENLFDTQDNPATADDDFLPNGNRYWHNGRYYHKLQQIAKVITAAGEWDTPALVGLCEVENDSVLHRLVNHTPLRHQHYRFCMTHGDDKRGINVAPPLPTRQVPLCRTRRTSHPIHTPPTQTKPAHPARLGKRPQRRPARHLCLPLPFALRRRKRERSRPLRCGSHATHALRLGSRPPPHAPHPHHGRL